MGISTINNELIDISYSYQTRLNELSEEDALKLLENAVINGREGFSCIKSSEDLTLAQALQTYRKKDSIEKIFHSLNNEIEIKPLRVWSEHSIYGALIIGFIAQLFISLMRYELKEAKNTSTKFIKKSLMNLTAVDHMKNGMKNLIYIVKFEGDFLKCQTVFSDKIEEIEEKKEVSSIKLGLCEF